MFSNFVQKSLLKKEGWRFENLKYHLWGLGRGKDNSIRSSDPSDALILSTKLKQDEVLL